MAIGTSFTDFRPMLHDYYSPEKATARAIDKYPTLRLLKKTTDWKGRDYIRPIQYEKPQNTGRDIATVLADKANHRARHDAWAFTTKDLYGVATLDRKTMMMSDGPRTFLRHYTAEVDGEMQQLMEDLATNIFRTSACVRSTVDAANSTLASGIVALASRWDSIHFRHGMDVVFSDAGGAAGATLHTPGSGGGRFTVDVVNRKAGTITITNGVGGAAADLTDAPTTVTTAIADGDFIHRRGEVTSASNDLGMIGFEDFILSAADRASPGIYKSVDRTKDVDRLCGLNVEAAGYSIENALIEGLNESSAANVGITHFVMHTNTFTRLVREVDSKLVRDDKEGSAKIGRRMVKVQLDAEEVRVYADPYCQHNKIWGLNVNDLDLKSVGALPGFIENDVRMLRDPAADGYEVRLGGYGELTFSYPGSHVHIELS